MGLLIVLFNHTPFNSTWLNNIRAHNKVIIKIMNNNTERGILRYKGKWSIITNKDFFLYDPDVLDLRPKHLFIALKSFINPDTDTAFPSIEYLSNILKWNVSTIFKHLKTLRKLGLIKVDKIRDKGMFCHNVYILEDELEWMKSRLIKNDSNNPQNF